MEQKEWKIKLAEFVGILLGDGCLTLKNKRSKAITRLKISCNSKDDFEYVTYLYTLVKELFGVEPKIEFRKNENTVDVLLFKKGILLFLINEVGMKLSPKWGRAKIPEKVLLEGYGRDVLRGYFDTDGSVVVTDNNGTIYPRLEMKICPSPMKEQFIELLKKEGFKFGAYEIGKGEVRIQLNGKEQLKKWIEKVGFRNQKHIEKAKQFLV